MSKPVIEPVKQNPETQLWDKAKEDARALAVMDVSNAGTGVHAERQVEEKDFWPGKINYVDSRGHHPGATCVQLYSTVDMDLGNVIDGYFQTNPGMLLLDVKPISDDAALVFYTRVVDKEELDDFGQVQRIAQTLMNELREAREKQKQEQVHASGKAQRDAEAALKAKMAELERLAELGKTHEKNCSKKGKK